MTPKEKAEILIQMFRNVTDGIAGYNYDAVNKECALVLVEEVIKSNPYKWVSFMNQYTETVLTSNIQYWQEVKQEIENL